MKNYILISTLLIPSIFLGSTTVANITSLKGNADIEFNKKLTPAKLKDELIKENSVITYEKGFTQLMFKDETIVSIGKNSKFSVEEYLGLETKKPEAKFSLFKGAMRVITGKIGKINPKRFKIKTKSATIGIRGTNFIVISVPGQGDMVICNQGGIYITGSDGKEHYAKKGYMARLDSNGNVEGVKAYNSVDLDVILKTVFNTNNVLQLSSRELLTYFDTLFDDDPTNDNDRKEVYTDESVKGDSEKNGKVYFGSDEEIKEDNYRIIPVEDTLALDEKEDDPMDEFTNDITEVSQDQAQDQLLTDELSNVYIYGTGNTATIIEDNNLINYYNKLGLSLSINPNTGTFSQDSIAIDNRSGTIFTFDSQMQNYTSAYNFDGTFSSSDSSNYEVLNGSYIKTISDLDANDEVTWGEWLIPLEVTNNSVTTSQVWRGNFIAGKLTDSSVISDYAQANLKGTYTGSLIGQAFELNNGSLVSSSFDGISTSTVSFGSGTVDTNLSFSVGNTNYDKTLNNTIDGNKFSGLNSSGAFYGADGKTIAGEFNFDDAINKRQLTGAFQGKTNTLSAQ